MYKPIVTGLMSYGMSGEIFHAPFLAAHPDFVFKAVVERHSKIAGVKYQGLISYDSIEQLLDDKEIELIIVNTPNNTHFEFALRTLNAGKHVLIEKPAAVTCKEARTLFALGRKSGLEVMIYHNRRFNSDYLSFKEVIESGSLGELTEVHFRIDRYRIAIGKKSFKESAETPGNGLIYDLGSHLVDGAISLFGKPLSFEKTTGRHRPGSRVDDYFHFHLKYPGQLNVYLTSSLLIAEAEHGFVAHGKKGSFLKMRTDVQELQLANGMIPAQDGFGVEPHGSEGKLVIINAQMQKEIQWIVAPTGAYLQLFDAIYQTIRFGQLFFVSEEQVIWQLEMLELS